MSKRFDWRRVAWGRPDSRPRELCAYCAGALPDVPLRVWKDDGSGASFCEACAELLLADSQSFLAHTKRMTGRRCLRCGHFQDASTGIHGREPPIPDDICVCYNCAHVMKFADDLSFRELTQAESIKLSHDPVLRALVQAITKGK
jgi:hypothetical protein